MVEQIVVGDDRAAAGADQDMARSIARRGRAASAAGASRCGRAAAISGSSFQAADQTRWGAWSRGRRSGGGEALDQITARQRERAHELRGKTLRREGLRRRSRNGAASVCAGEPINQRLSSDRVTGADASSAVAPMGEGAGRSGDARGGVDGDWTRRAAAPIGAPTHAPCGPARRYHARGAVVRMADNPADGAGGWQMR